MDKNYIYQISTRDWLEKSLGTDIMVPVLGIMINNEYDIYFRSFLIHSDLKKFKGFCFKDVITYTQDEFEREFIREIEN